VRALLEQTRAQIPALTSLLAQAQDRLATLLAVTTAALPPGVFEARELPSAPARVAVGIPADTLRQRPDIRAAERRLAAETARIGQTLAARYPDLTLSGSIGLEALSLGALGAGSALTHSIVAGVTGLLFDGGRIARRVDVQEAVRDQAAIAYEKAVLTALQEVESALAAVRHAQARRRILDEAVIAARNAATYAAQRYSSGIVDFQAVLDTQRSLLGVEDARVSSHADETAAVVRLYKALGGGWTPAPAPALQDGTS
jgi:outer membrane protein TolC